MQSVKSASQFANQKVDARFFSGNTKLFIDMTEIKEQLQNYIRQHPDLSAFQIKEEISRQLKGEIFPGEIDEMFEEIIKISE